MAGSTWTWLGSTSALNSASNWSLTGGTGNAKGYPQSGDTAIFTGAGVTPQFLDTSISSGTTLDLTGSGTVQFLNDGSVGNSTSIDPTSVLNAAGAATTLLINGPFTNQGLVEVTGTGDHLVVTVAADGQQAGSFSNSGTIAVNQGDSLAITTTGSATFADMGAVFVTGGSALISGSVTGPANFAISQSGTLELNQVGTAAFPDVTFNGSGLLKLDQPGNFGGFINGFTLGDTLDLGVVNVATVEFDGSGDLIVLGTNGGTLLFAQSDNGALGGDGGPISFVLNGSSGLAGDLQVTQGGGGDTTITEVGPSTWLWENGASAAANTAADWSVVSGPGNGFGTPNADDTAIDAGGTILGGGDFQLTGNTIELGGTASLAALLAGGGGPQPSVDSPSLDQNSVITSDVASTGTFVGNSTPETSFLGATGTFVNQGEIEANGPAGSRFTIAVTSTTVNGTLDPGYFINDSQIEVAPGNSMTISVGGTSEFFNAGLILVNGGSLLVNVDTAALFGGYAPGSGVAVIEGDGTVETHAGYASTVNGNIPVYAFDGATAGATLKIDNIGSFGGNILGFSQGDTIDIGTSIAVAKLAYSSSTGVLALENTGGTIIDSLLLGSGAFQTGTFTLSGSIADGFTIGTGGDNNTILTTSVVTDTDASNSGAWQTGSLWSTGVPGTLATAIIGSLGGGTLALTTGAAPVSVGGLVITGGQTSLQITSATTANGYPIRQYAGTLEVTSGNTLTASQLVQTGGTGQIDPAALLDLTGHISYAGTGANGGTIAVQTSGTQALQVDSSFLVNGGTLNAGVGQSGGNGGRIFIGYQGGATPATMTVQNSGTNAAVVTDTYAIIASDPTSFGDLTLNGNATWTDEIDPHDTASTRGYIDIGYNNQASLGGTVAPPPFSGTATLAVENGATLTEGLYGRIGATTDSAGSVLVTNALWNIGTGTTGGFLDVGFLGNGTMTVDTGGTVVIGHAATFVSNGSTVSGSGINVGNSAVSNGTLTVQNGGLITDGAGMNVGQSGQGLLSVLNGGTINLTGTAGITVGLSATSSGTLVIAGTNSANGASSLVNWGTASRGLAIGNGGRGTVEIETGGTLQMNGTAGVALGEAGNAAGLLVINGPAALFSEGTASTGLAVGQSGNGTIEIGAGGTFQINATGTNDGIGVGENTGSTGLIVVSGNGALLSMNDALAGIGVGQSGQGTLEVQSGGSVSISGYGLSIGTNSSGGGSVTVSGSGSAITTTGTSAGISVGVNESGSLTISNGGSVASSTGVWIGQGSSTGNGTVTVNGGTLTGAGLTVGNGGSGTLIVEGGGLVSNTGSTSGFNIGSFGSGNGTVVVNGGTLNDSAGGFVGVGNTAASGSLVVEGSGKLITGGMADLNASGTGHSADAVVSGGTWIGNGQLIVGDTGTGSLDINGDGLVNAGSFGVDVGNQSGGIGNISLESGGTLATSGMLFIGQNGSGTVASALNFSGQSQVVSAAGMTIGGFGNGLLEVDVGGTADSTGLVTLGMNAGSSGQISLGGGQLIANGIVVGSSGSGNLDGTGVVSDSGNLIVGQNAGSSGTVDLPNGFGGSTVGGNLVIGSSGTGAVTLAQGTGITVSGAFNAIGNNAGGVGSLVLESGSTVQVTGSSVQLSVGATGANGTLAAAEGSVLVSGGLLNLASTATIGSNLLGLGTNGGSGTLTVSQGGTVDVSTGSSFSDAILAANAVGSTATMTVTGSQSLIDVSGGILLASGGAASLLIANNASVLVSNAENLGVGIGGGGGFGVVGGTAFATVTSGGLLDVGAPVISGGTLFPSSPDNPGVIDVGSNGATGVLTVSNDGTVDAGAGIVIGSGGSGSVDINTGGVVNTDAGFTTGLTLPGTGSFVSGTATSVTIGQSNGGGGTLSLESGGSLNAGAISIAAIGGTGLLSVAGGTVQATSINDGTGGTITVSSGLMQVETLTIVVGGTTNASIVAGPVTIDGVLTMTGGTVTTGAMTVGNQSGETANVSVSGGSLLTEGLFVGAGTLTVQGAGQVSNTGTNGVAIGGTNPGSTGAVVVNGGSLSDTTSFFGIGNSGGTGTLLVENGGSLITGGTTAFADINATGGTALATVTGATWTSYGQIIVGDSGNGSLDINSNGVVNAGTNQVTIGQSKGGAGTVSLESGGMLVAGALVLDNAVLGNSTGVLDVAGGMVTAGSLTVNAGGEISVTGGSVTVNGAATIGNNGSIVILNGTTVVTAAGLAGASLTLSGGLVTTSGLTVAANSASNGTVTVNGGTLDDTSFLTIGNAGDGLVTVNSGGSLIAAGGVQIDSVLIVADAPGATTVPLVTGNGTLEVDGGSVTDTGGVTIGNGGDAVVMIEAGGTFTANGTNTGFNQVSIGSTNGGAASVTVNDALFNLVNETLFIGDGGDGTLLIENAGTVTSTYSGAGPAVDINASGSAQASAIVSGANVVWSLNAPNAQFVVGDNGTGSLLVTSGAVVNTGSSVVDIGNQSGGAGQVTVSNDATLVAGQGNISVDIGASGASGTLTAGGSGTHVNAAGDIDVGGAGTGNLVVNSSATVSAGLGFDIAALTGSGNATVSGFQSLLTTSGSFAVGDTGLGSLAIQSGATVITGGLAVITQNAAGAGSTANVNGGGSNWHVSGLLEVGNGGAGSLAITAGGIVTAGTVDVGTRGNGAGFVTVVNADLTAGSLVVGDAGFGQLSLSQGGTVTAGGLDAGANGSAVISLSGSGTDLALTGDATVADDGSATMSILNGATMTGTDLTIGSQGNASGALTVSDTGSLLQLSGTLYVGTTLGVGELTVGPNATIIATSIQQQGQVVLEGGLLDPNVIVVGVGYSNGGYGTAGGTGDLIDNDGTLLAAAGSKSSQKVQTFLGTIVGQGIMQINAGSTLEVGGPVLSGDPSVDINNDGTPVPVSSSQDVVFSASTGVLKLDDIGAFAGTVGTYLAGDQFIITGGVLSGLGVSGGTVLTVNDSGDGGVDQIAFAAPISAGQFSIVGGNTIDVVQCFAAGTLIETASGPVAVEALCEGDLVVTAEDGRLEPVVWVGRRAVNCAAHPQPEQVWPVRVRKGAFGPQRPVRNLFLSPDHAVFVNDVLVPVKYLVNGTSIAQVQRPSVVYYHVELPQHDLLLAEGLAVESYLDVGDRSNFENGGGAVALFPNFTSLKWETEGCAPLVVCGAELEAARRIVNEHVATLAQRAA